MIVPDGGSAYLRTGRSARRLSVAAGWVTEPDTGVDPWEALLNRAAED